MGCKHRKVKNLKGIKFGKLTVLDFVRIDKNYKSVWLCKCDCGKEIEVVGGNLTSGNQKSCGCNKEKRIKWASNLNKTHGDTGTKLYKIWIGMKNRCNCAGNNGYKNYGARGIKVCDEWNKSYINFKEWALKNGYKDGLSIDRVNVNKDYEPNNCRWVTIKEQANNRRSNHLITYKGETHNITEWARKNNVEPYIIFSRLRNGWSVEKALNEKVRRLKRR